MNLPRAHARYPVVASGPVLAQVREWAGLTQRELADYLGTTPDTVSRLERRTLLSAAWESHLTLLFAYLFSQRRGS